MIPVLYKANETEFNSQGVGCLTDCITCYVHEKLNGVYELKFTYPITGVHFSDIKVGAIVDAIPSDGKAVQHFRIDTITKPIGGKVTVEATHISYQLSYVPVKPFDAVGVLEALNGLKENSLASNPFSVWTDISNTATKYTQKEPASFRQRLGGVAGSILDCFGGEYEFDNYTVKLHAHRGTDRGVVIEYGKNLTDLEQEESIDKVITGIVPFWKDSNGDKVVSIETPIESEYASKYPFKRTVVKDFSSNFEEEPTVEQLRTYTESYIKNNCVGVPQVSLDVSFVALEDTEEYKSLSRERINLGDTVTVRFAELGVDAKAKAIEYKYDVLAERYDSLKIGSVRSSLASTISEITKVADNAVTKSILDAVIKYQTELIKGGFGGYLVTNYVNGYPSEIICGDSPNIEQMVNCIRLNKNGLGISKSGYNGPYSTAITGNGINASLINFGEMDGNLIKAKTLQIGSFDEETENTITSSLSEAVTEWYVSTSPTELMGGSWSESRPAWTETNYIWQRLRTENKKGEISYSEPSCVQGNTGAKGEQGAQGISVSNITNFYKASDKSTGIVAPQSSGGRNLYYLYNFNALNLANVSSHSVDNGEISLTASGSDLYIGEVLPINGKWDEMFSPLIKVDGAKTVTYTVTNKLFTANYYNFLNKDKRAITGYKRINNSTATLTVPNGAVYLAMRFGYTQATKNTVYKLRIKVELGSKATDWTPAPEDYGWSTTPPQLTATNKYMWNYSMISGSSNEVLSYTPATMIGVYGDKGIDGKGVKSAEIAYQAWTNGTSTPNGTWVTTVPDTTADKPYLWTRTVITYTDDTKSTSYSVGSTLKGVNVGGRNLLRGSAKTLIGSSNHSIGQWRLAGSHTMSRTHTDISDPPKNCSAVTGAYQAVGKHPPSSEDGECIGMDDFPYLSNCKIGDICTFSAWARVVGGGKNCYFGFSTYMCNVKNDCYDYDKFLNNYAVDALNEDGSWTRIVIHFKLTKLLRANIYVGFLTGDEEVTVQACAFKIEVGNIATDWTPAPEDVDDGISNAQTTAHSAQTNASTAQQTANDAQTTANNALNKADSAQASANSAIKSYQDAINKAKDAQISADRATELANGAQQGVSTIEQVVKIDTQGVRIYEKENSKNYVHQKSDGSHFYTNNAENGVLGPDSRMNNLAVNDYFMSASHRMEYGNVLNQDASVFYHIGKLKKVVQ